MATLITRTGGFLKIVIDANKPKYFCLGQIELPKVNGDFVTFEDGNTVDINDVSTPSVASGEELADIIGTYIKDYNTGQ